MRSTAVYNALCTRKPAFATLGALTLNVFMPLPVCVCGSLAPFAFSGMSCGLRYAGVLRCAAALLRKPIALLALCMRWRPRCKHACSSQSWVNEQLWLGLGV